MCNCPTPCTKWDVTFFGIFSWVRKMLLSRPPEISGLVPCTRVFCMKHGKTSWCVQQQQRFRLNHAQFPPQSADSWQHVQKVGISKSNKFSREVVQHSNLAKKCRAMCLCFIQSASNATPSTQMYQFQATTWTYHHAKSPSILASKTCRKSIGIVHRIFFQHLQAFCSPNGWRTGESRSGWYSVLVEIREDKAETAATTFVEKDMCGTLHLWKVRLSCDKWKQLSPRTLAPFSITFRILAEHPLV